MSLLGDKKVITFDKNGFRIHITFVKDNGTNKVTCYYYIEKLGDNV